MWKAVTSFFGSSEGISKTIDAVSSGIDMAVYTPEEKSLTNQKILDWKLKMATAIGPQSLARRVIAFIIVGIWAYILLLMVHLKLLGMTEQADHLVKVLTDIVAWPFITVVGFYFLANIARANK